MPAPFSFTDKGRKGIQKIPIMLFPQVNLAKCKEIKFAMVVHGLIDNKPPSSDKFRALEGWCDYRNLYMNK